MAINKQSIWGLIAEIDRQIAKCLSEIKRLVELDKELNSSINKLATIKGVGLMTIVTILAETMGFDHFHNAKQLVSYAGYDVVRENLAHLQRVRPKYLKKGTDTLHCFENIY